MARNAEKAMTTLARWRAAQVQEAGGQRERRPYLASECNDLQQAEKWRLQIVREIAKKVAQIQNEENIGEAQPLNLQNLRESSIHSQNELTSDPDTIENIEPAEVDASRISPVVTSPKQSLQSPRSPVIIGRQDFSSPRKTSPLSLASQNPGSIAQTSVSLSIKSDKVNKPVINMEHAEYPQSSGSIAKMSINSSIKSDKVKKPSDEVKKPEINMEHPENPSAKSLSSVKGKDDIIQSIIDLEPQGKNISDHVDELNETVRTLSKNVGKPHSPVLNSNIDKITNMSQILTNEANALKKSIKSLSEDITRTKMELLAAKEEDVNFPYHLFLIELIINKIHMKCECFEFDYNNLVITASFLGKQPIVLYDASYGKVNDFTHLNVGKSALFAITYDKICSIKEFIIKLQIVKQPPCSSCITKVGETRADYTKDFVDLRDELCKKWALEQPTDNIICTTSTPMSKNMFYLSCGDSEKSDSIGVIEISARMSFLGKEITTAFIASPKQHGTSLMQKEDNGMSMYSCQNVELDGKGKVLLDEDYLVKKEIPHSAHTMYSKRPDSPVSQYSSGSSKHYYGSKHVSDGIPKYDEIFTKMNANELKIRVPKTTKVERMGKYDKIQELCSCEENPYNTGDQIQFELPRDLCYNAGLGEFRIRDLNDEINKLMREKRHWEVQIKALGGPDHARVGPKMLDQDGKEVPGNRGYKYFGAAKDLPGVRELFEQEPPPPARRTRADLMRDVDADYYGYRDDDDGLLLPLEKEAEKKAIAQAIEEWRRNKEQNEGQDLPEEENIYPEDPDDKRIEDDDDITDKPSGTSLVAVPSQKDIEEALLRRKKQELLERYGCLDVKLENS
ncbi:unnamed protein product [Parnassius apollo]|uniref:(apollo) hypothetical protein n=1 Tax=Parnassius apollo TaxID=110799 RepID=A0A8S3XPU2_PARAO|nr:unnamed protein product [Parnassius apollo]